MPPQPSKEEFVKLIQENTGIILKICNAYCRNKNDREDLAQEIIYNLWKSGKSLNPAYRFTTWMYRVALNVAISFYRAEKRAASAISLSETNIDIEDTSTHWSEKEQNINLLQQFIAGLKELDKALILLYFEAKTYREIAEILGISETNVATKLSRIKDNLKNKFKLYNQTL